MSSHSTCTGYRRQPAAPPDVVGHACPQSASPPPSLGLASRPPSLPPSTKQESGGEYWSTTSHAPPRHVAMRFEHSQTEAHGGFGAPQMTSDVGQGSPDFGKTLGHRSGREGAVVTTRHRPSSPHVASVFGQPGHDGMKAHGVGGPGQTRPRSVHAVPSVGKELDEHPRSAAPTEAVPHAATSASTSRARAEAEAGPLCMLSSIAGRVPRQRQCNRSVILWRRQGPGPLRVGQKVPKDCSSERERPR